MDAIALALVLAALDWIAVATGRRKAEYVLKPLTMVALFVAAIVIDPLPTQSQMFGAHTFYFVLAAIVFSLIGDVFLMLPSDRFVQGLVAFLIAHLCYVAAFAQSFEHREIWVVAIVIGVVSAALYRRIRAGIVERGLDKLLIPVTLYVVVISLMVLSAVGTTFIDITPTPPLRHLPMKGWGAWGPVIGGILFYVSDALIGWTRFVRDFRASRVWIMVTYHLGQIGLVMTVAYV